MKGFAMSFLFCNGVLLGVIRYGFRNRYNIRSNALGDFISSLFFYPQVLAQMQIHCIENGIDGSDDAE